MTHRGRKSAAERAVFQGVREPPEPPTRLSKPEVAVWREITRARPSQFGAGSLALLETYCMLVVTTRALQQELRATSVEDGRFKQLLAMHTKESAALTRLAARLRLLPEKAEQPKAWPPPWQIRRPDDDEDEVDDAAQ